MAYTVGDQVYVPKSRVGLQVGGGSAFHRTTVERIEGRSVVVRLPGGGQARVATSAVHRDIGILIIRIGDFESEEVLLDPLTKSILQFFRVLVTDDHVRRIEIRSRGELELFWQSNHGAFSHVVITAHGSSRGIKFGVDGEVLSRSIIQAFTQPDLIPKLFILLACETGQNPFAQEFSASNLCSALIAPYHSVHGAESSLFCQAFLTNHLLKGQTIHMAFKHASESLPENSFRLWRCGGLSAGFYSR